MCQAHGNHIGKCPRCAFLRPKNEMSKSKIENAKIENSKNPRLLSEESAEHPTLPLPVRGRCPSSENWQIKGHMFDIFSSLHCWIRKLFCRPFSITFTILATICHTFDFEMVSNSWRTNSKNWKMKSHIFEISKLITIYSFTKSKIKCWNRNFESMICNSNKKEK